jgi:hypothetical protein
MFLRSAKHCTLCIIISEDLAVQYTIPISKEIVEIYIQSKFKRREIRTFWKAGFTPETILKKAGGQKCSAA